MTDWVHPVRNRDEQNVLDQMEILGAAELELVWDRAKELHIDAFGSPMGCLDQALCEVLKVDDLRNLESGNRHAPYSGTDKQI